MIDYGIIEKMKILYNPKNGSPIEKFIFNGIMLAPHKVGGLKQYDDAAATELLKLFGFLEEKTPIQAQEIINKQEAKFKCEYSKYESDKKIGLIGHMRGHEKEIKKAKEPAVDPSVVPVAEGTKVEPRNLPSATHPQDSLKIDSSFYGPGLIETRGV